MYETQTTPSSSPARPLPKWATALIVLQSITLFTALSGQAGSQAAHAGQRSGDRPPPSIDEDSRGGQGAGLPNAAEQRIAQIRLLAQIHEELVKVNGKLDGVNDQLKAQAKPEPDQQ